MFEPRVEIAHPPETAEGWYALHQIVSVDRRALRDLDPARSREIRALAVSRLCALVRRPTGDNASSAGWSVLVSLIGSQGDAMFVHFRESLDALGEVQAELAREPLFDFLVPRYSFLSVTEAGFYHITAEAAKEANARGGKVGDPKYAERVAERVSAEVASPHVRGRLYPPLPAEMPYVSFYPMSKRRAPDDNWYTLSIAERSALMIAHGMTGRRYAGRVVQVITGAIGLSAWEWGVTLFARDPLDFKRIVTDMRFDEASARYAEFGEFYVGRLTDPEAWVGALLDR